MCRRCGSHSPSPLAILPYLDDGRSKYSTRYWLVLVICPVPVLYMQTIGIKMCDTLLFCDLRSMAP